MHADTARALLAWARAHEAEMLDMLERLVNIQSGSGNAGGLARVRRVLTTELVRTGLRVEKRGAHLLASTRPQDDARPGGLLVGHFDTVFPSDTDFRTLRREGERVIGPGVTDMKGGLIVTIFALRALREAGLLPEAPLRVLFNADEEVGSTTSRPLLKELAERSAFAFVMECGGLDGAVVTGRKGRFGFRVEVEGRAGHAAFAGQDKASAIVDLAHRVLALEALNDPDASVSVNVGVVQGGIGYNTVPESAVAVVDVRYVTEEQRARVEARCREVVARTVLPGTRATWVDMTGRPAMEPSEGNLRLYDMVAKAAGTLGLTVPAEHRSGVSDANYVAAAGTPVVDGLGPIGADDHSSREWMLVSSLAERTALLAASVATAAADWCGQSAGSP
jgi:glutamate carboxypeptidase